VSTSLSDIGHVTTSHVDGLEIRLARGGRSDGVPILLTSPWPESIYAYRAIWPEIAGLGPLIAVDLSGFGAQIANCCDENQAGESSF
jgi:pimeloyl-ACP methyl ester carboxylesterase